MSDLLQGESGQRFIGLITILTVCGGPFFVGAWALWLAHRKHERQDDLKREMLERGMSADDIVRVLNAAPQPGRGTPPGSTPPHGKA
jgi:hypothetical protein